MADDQNTSIPENPTESRTPTVKRALPPLRSAPGTRAPLPSPRATAAAPQRPAPTPPTPKPVAGGTTPTLSGPALPESQTAASPRMQPARLIPPKPIKPKQDKPPENDQGVWRMSRKNFLNVAGWFAFFSFLGTATLGAIRLMVPRVLYEQPSAFKAGFPQDYVIGEVNEKYKDEYRVWIIREAEGFYALLAICTHLGCTPRWLAAENKFKCPCHGSGYHKDGINFEGPTPRPLERLKITLADDGQILIDRAVKFLYEKQEWAKPGAFLKFS